MTASTVDSSACTPTIRYAGFPGSTRVTTNVMSDTPNSATTRNTNRRPM